MASSIDPAIPPFGNPTTSGVRGNFLTAKTEIEALQAEVAALRAYMTGLWAGFEDPDNVTLAWDNVTRTFTISPISGSFSFYAGGTLYSKSAAQSISIPDVTGNYYFYFNTSGVLTVGTAFDDNFILLYAFAAKLYYNATTNLAVPDAVIEMHQSYVPSQVHLYLHGVMGCRYDQAIGGLLPIITVDGDGSQNAHIQVAASAGALWDDAVRVTIPSRLITDAIPKLYLTGSGADWTFAEATAQMVVTTGSGRAAFNQFVTGSWTLTEVTNNNYVLLHLFAFPGFTKRWLIVVGQAQYATIALAQAAAQTEIKNIVQIPLPEALPVATFIAQTSDTYTNSVKSRLVSVSAGNGFIDWRYIWQPT